MLIKYYVIVLFSYFLEILSIKLLLNFYEDIVIINFINRIFYIFISSIFLRIFVFKTSNCFYFRFYVGAALNPFLSSSLFGLILFSYPEINPLLSKILSDVMISLILYFLILKRRNSS